MIFSADEYEWDVHEKDIMKELVKIENNGRRIKKVGKYLARIRLKNACSAESRRSFRISLQSDSSDITELNIRIGVISDDWDEPIVYSHSPYEPIPRFFMPTHEAVTMIMRGCITENGNKMKTIKQLEINSSIMIQDKPIIRIENGKIINSITFTLDGEDVYSTFYVTENGKKKIPYLCLNDQVTVDIDVSGKILTNCIYIRTTN